MHPELNPFMKTDVYKMGHGEQFKPETSKIYSNLVARHGDELPEVLMYGTQALLKKYLLVKPQMWMINEFLELRKEILGTDISPSFERRMRALPALGYFPLKIKAVPEGTVLPVKNVLMTMVNTHPDHAWLPGFFESLLLKLWNTCTVASYDLKFARLVKRFANETCQDGSHLPFQVHDFGYRGCSSEETAEFSGSAHLINFLGTDTVPAVKFVKDYYGGSKGPIGLSVPASEHSVMCSYGPANELQAFKSLMKIYPTGILSIVSDTYNLWNVLTNFTETLRHDIENRDGKIVFRPDSGDPEKIICGDPNGRYGSAEWLGALRILGEKFGTSTNNRGFKVLNPKVGLIYGDGMYYERFERVLNRMKDMGYASSNLVIGIGGLLLQQHNRDEQGYAIKATYSEVGGQGGMELFKDPITDPGKKSFRGLLKLDRYSDGRYYTKDGCTPEEESQGFLQTVYEDGRLVNEVTFDEIRKRAAEAV